ncbi:MAG: UDP-N-acetylmuramoyl-L-alanyl-D-glutamate--2,6-diaminopimelate ligase [Candidatus Pacebacteria bacterium]|nr:UDP-N-acetylmuramoyl-L-alanyl-D-glutamate--2,6-diaminopimelate ligase [Candidatus Paceibacterota bacterium]
MLSKLKKLYHFSLSFLGAVIYNFPSKDLYVIGITGTKGKSTTAEILYFILKSAGFKTAMLSSANLKVGDIEEINPTSNTMPGRFFIQKFLYQAKKSGCKFAILEVTSQGVVQYRDRFIDFDCGIFLNIHPEHIEYHGSFENYLNAKLKFFDNVATKSRKKEKLFITNIRDKESEKFASIAKGFGRIIKFNSLEIREKLFSGKEVFKNWFDSDFNIENASAATSIALELGVSKEKIISAISAFVGVSGRMEFVTKNPFEVIVDYAHTPDSMQAVYSSLKKMRPNRKLICVFGSAGGGRDKWKRPEFGKIASDYCDEIILTNEDPYDENPEEILNEISKGIYNHKKYQKIIDRGEAIKIAISLAKSQDVVVITGKGSERSIRVAKGKKISWSDKEAVQKLIR